MKKVGKSSKKGFTLVELIVVIVILAVLAAMLVPALVGYIDRAKKEKDYQTASTVYAAAQAVLTEQYGRGNITKDATSKKYSVTSIANGTYAGDSSADAVLELAGVDSSKVTAYNFTVSADTLIITWGSVSITNGDNTATYYLYTDGTWGVKATTDGSKPA
ncbi:MAG: type II secretion system protein [Clostridiales bacterium]|nr:type II secretion system protein [Clostridiales bacterium]